MNCVKACPTDAVASPDIKVIEDRCIGCGSCAVSCPSGAFVLTDLMDETLITKINTLVKERKTIHFYCQRTENLNNYAGENNRQLKK
jgi:Fe-S-cluster-containing hydrogenase component 2